MKIILYGIGKRFYSLFNNQEFIEKGLIKNNVELVGFSDSSNMVCGKEIIYLNKKFEIKKIYDFSDEYFDKIVITSKIYFEEIKNRLIQSGYKKEKILSIDWFYKLYLDNIYHIENYTGKAGIEIGGPSALFYNIYEECASCDNINFSATTVWGKNETNDFKYNNEKLGSNIISDATDMYQVPSEIYEFLLSSNNLEHIANPLKALKEFNRILQRDGCILVLVPRKERTFDHNREYTLFEHLLDDYLKNVGEDDLSHLPEIVENHDYSLDPPCGGKDNFIKRAKDNINNRCLHHHVFDEECLRKAFQFVGINILDFGIIEDNWFILGRK